MPEARAPAVVVTGASKGIGAACVARLAGRGFHVFAGVRSDSDGDRLRETIADSVTPVRLDITDAGQIEAAAATIRDTVGDRGLAGIVDNAGIVIAGPLEFLPIHELRRQLEVNVIGQVAVTQAVLPLIRRATGRIVLIGSISGRNALPLTGAYAASKFALEAIADAWRVELRPWSIHVAMIEPGVIATPIWDTSLAAADALLEEAPPELDRYYGRIMAGIRRRALAGPGRGRPPADVARVVEHALTARRPRARYVVGRDARLRLAINAVLPTRARDWLVAKVVERL